MLSRMCKCNANLQLDKLMQPYKLVLGVGDFKLHWNTTRILYLAKKLAAA